MVKRKPRRAPKLHWWQMFLRLRRSKARQSAVPSAEEQIYFAPF